MSIKIDDLLFIDYQKKILLKIPFYLHKDSHQIMDYYGDLEEQVSPQLFLVFLIMLKKKIIPYY